MAFTHNDQAINLRAANLANSRKKDADQQVQQNSESQLSSSAREYYSPIRLSSLSEATKHRLSMERQSAANSSPSMSNSSSSCKPTQDRLHQIFRQNSYQPSSASTNSRQINDTAPLATPLAHQIPPINSMLNYQTSNDTRAPWRASLPPTMIPRRQYTGVDELILAAMIDEQRTYHLNSNPMAHNGGGYIPTGRGIGYPTEFQNFNPHIPVPRNKSEFELFKLLERANLLEYFGIFLDFGGDDVQQLNDADEDEFLEIMSLVGMTQKPLHVRRLQKALADWRECRDAETRCGVSQSSFQNSFKSSNSDVLDREHQTNFIQPRPLYQTSVPVESPALTPASSCSQLSTMTSLEHNNHSTTSNANSSCCLAPHEVFIGAPKRPRLMDKPPQPIEPEPRDLLLSPVRPTKKQRHTKRPIRHKEPQSELLCEDGSPDLAPRVRTPTQKDDQQHQTEG